MRQIRTGSASPAFVRVLIVEDHDSYREFLSSVMRKRPEFRVISQAADGVQAVRIAEELRPDLILLDIGLPGLNGIEAARRILRLCPDSKILFVSQESAEEIVLEALSTGANGYLLKTDVASELMAAISSVLMGERFMSMSIGSVESRHSS